MIILSICIPSYDRFDLLERNLKGILGGAESKEFEVVVVDNCSPDNIYDAINIEDSRLRILRRSVAVSGPRNVNDSLSYAKGKYSLLCLDKDRIKGELIDQFINTLKAHPKICGGYCTILPTKNQKIEIYTDHQVLKFGYIGKHPSGDFYKTEYVKSAYSRFNDEDMENTYVYDWLLAECAAHGPMMKYDYPIMEKAPPHKARERQSSSFSPHKRNLFLLPPNIIEQFYLNCMHLENLPIPKKEYFRVLMHLYRIVLHRITLDYRTVMTMSDVCFHYHIEPKKVSFKEMCHWWWVFIRGFWCRTSHFPWQEKWIKRTMMLIINMGFIGGRWRKFL